MRETERQRLGGREGEAEKADRRAETERNREKERPRGTKDTDKMNLGAETARKKT